MGDRFLAIGYRRGAIGKSRVLHPIAYDPLPMALAAVPIAHSLLPLAWSEAK